MDMKYFIAEAAKKLIFEEKKKRLTVKDIVDNCHITRQTFYYHFTDIPELLTWIVQDEISKVASNLEIETSPEEQIKHWIQTYVNLKDYLQKGYDTNYGKELEDIVSKEILNHFRSFAAGKDSPHNDYDKDFILRYQCYAIMGILNHWTKEDNENIDRIAHNIFSIVKGEMK